MGSPLLEASHTGCQRHSISVHHQRHVGGHVKNRLVSITKIGGRDMLDIVCMNNVVEKPLD